MWFCLTLVVPLFGVSPGALAQHSCDQIVAEAKSRFNAGDFDEAIRTIDLCLQQIDLSEKEKESAYALLVECHISKNEKQQALQYMQKLLEVAPGYAPDPEKHRPEFLKIFHTVKQKPTQKPQEEPALITPSKTDTVATMKSTAIDSSQSVTPVAPFYPLIQSDANVLGRLEMNLGIGSNFGLEDSVGNPALAHLRIGLDIAELEFRTAEIVNGFNNGKNQHATLGIKFRLLPENSFHSKLPAFTAIGRVDLDLGNLNSDTLPDTNLRFHREVRNVLVFFSKTFDVVQFHAGLNYNYLRAYVNPLNSSSVDTTYDNEEYRFFGTLQWRVRSLAMLMVDWEPIIEYPLVGKVPLAPRARDVVTIRVRALLMRSLAFDVGWVLRLKAGHVNPADKNFRLKLGVNVGLSLTEVFHELQGQ